MTIFNEYSITPIGAVLILLILILSGVTRKKLYSTHSRGWIAISMIALAIILGSAEEWLSYTFLGIGLAISVYDFVRGQMSIKSEKGTEDQPSE